MKTIAAVLGAAFVLQGQPQDGSALSTALAQNRFGLAVKDGQFSGPGAAVLRSAISRASFVLGGETHGLAETSRFWTALCHAAGPEGFRTMAIEEGPLTAAELEKWARARDGRAQLAAFEKRYPGTINIYGAVEEFEMLQSCGDRLWGINQEGLGAAGFMVDRVLELLPPGESAVALRRLRQKNDDGNAKSLQTGKISDLLMLSADDRELAADAALIEKGGPPQARAIFASFIESHEINVAWPADGGRRFRMMKRLFAADYAAGGRPKVLLKFGEFHIYRGWNPVHESGLGNYVAELAAGQGAESLHISVMAVKQSTWGFARPGQQPQLRSSDLRTQPGSRYLEPVLSNVLPADWTLFDLRPLRDVVRRAPGRVTPELATLIFGIDLLVMVPEGTPSTRIHD